MSKNEDKKEVLVSNEIEELLSDFEQNKANVLKNKESFSGVSSAMCIIDNDSLLSIQELRRLTGLSQSKFAKKYHISVYTLRRWEQGVSATPEWYLYSLNELFRYQGYFYNV